MAEFRSTSLLLRRCVRALAFSAVFALLRKFSVRSLAGLLARVLGAGYMAAAGHVLFSVTAGYFFSFVIVYARAFLCGDQRGERP